MTPLQALVGILVLLLLAAVGGLLLQRRNGRLRTVTGSGRIDPSAFNRPALNSSVLNSSALDSATSGTAAFGAVGTVVQFSTVYCARCPGMRRQLTELVGSRDGLEFVHVDLTDDPALAKRFSVRQTPTLLLLDGSGTPRSRLSGPISRTTLTTALDALTGETP